MNSAENFKFHGFLLSIIPGGYACVINHHCYYYHYRMMNLEQTPSLKSGIWIR